MVYLDIPIYNKEGNLETKKKVSLKTLPKKGEDLISEVIRREMLNKKASLSSTKTKGEVRGGGAKPWRQKGTGRARAGSIRSPIWRGGGIVFGPTKEKKYSKKINKKMKQKVLSLALIDKVQNKRFYILENPSFKKTRQFDDYICKIINSSTKKKERKKIVYFLDSSEKNIANYISNIDKLKILFNLNLKDILEADFFIASPLGFKNIEKRITAYGQK